MGKPGKDDEIVDPFEPRKVRVSMDFRPKDLLKEIVTSGWRASAPQQETTFCKMHIVWAAFTEKQKYEAFANSRAHVNRLKIQKGGEEAQWELFNKIMVLKDEVTVRRALLWDPRKWKSYTPEKWEKPYLELPGFVGEFIDCYKESSVPLPFFAWAAIGLIGVCSKYNLYVQAGGEELLHNLYLFLVGDSAVGKSYAKNCATNVIKLLNSELNTIVPATFGPRGIPHTLVYERPDLWINQLSQDGTYEGGIARLAAIRKIPLQRIVKGSDGRAVPSPTGQFADAAAVLIVDEVSEHFGKGDWAADKKVAGYTAMYTGKERSKSTVGAGDVFYDHQAFSMLVCGAIEWFKGAVTPAMLGGGFMDRSLFVYRVGTNRIYTALRMPIIDPIKEVALAKRLVPIASPPNAMRRRVDISPGAADFLDEVSIKEFQYEVDVRNKAVAKDENYKSSAVRREHQKIKIASILALSEASEPGVSLYSAIISREHMALSHLLLTNEDKHFQTFIEAVSMTGMTVFTAWLYDQYRAVEFKTIVQRSLLSKTIKIPKFNIHTTEDLVRKLDVLIEGGVLTRVQTVVNARKHTSARTTMGYRPTKDDEIWAPYLP